MSYSTTHIANIINASTVIKNDSQVDTLLLDSRKIHSAESGLFFAIRGERRDGHLFIPDLYEQGVRNFVISQPVEQAYYPEANFLLVPDTLKALQDLVAFHRTRFQIPVIGITGSNGKTIVKEWLYQLLQNDYKVVRSPKSYNSQIGVPLSVWQMNAQHTLGIFEAGISRPGEMARLARIIQPTIAVLTNIGEAHSEGFGSREEKELEKKILLEHSSVPQKLKITNCEKKQDGTTITAEDPLKENSTISIWIPFTDEASIDNAVTCWELMILLGYDQDVIGERVKGLMPVNMRLELKKAINHCTLINDSYSADLSSLEIALNFLAQQNPNEKKTAILSDFLQSSLGDDELYTAIHNTLGKHRIQRLIGIGERISAFFGQVIGRREKGLEIKLYSSTQEFIEQYRSTDFKEETILIKGARVFSFELIVQMFEQKVHQTVLDINLNAIVHNLHEYQRALKPATKVMAMVKAFAYGSGGAEIAGILQYHKVDYLGVAYADEGIDLRKAGIRIPIMVMNPEENTFESITENNLEPEIYSFPQLRSFEKFLEQEGILHYPVHVEIETGMNRLGFPESEIAELANFLASSERVKVQSVFSHLAASEDPDQDDFTLGQARKFENAAGILQEKLNYTFIKHIANSAAIVRHPSLQLDMVRLGIGMYGVDSSGGSQLHLQTVATLRSTIAQVKPVKAGESVSYNRRGKLEKDAVIATVRMGYADGYPRRLGNGIGKVVVKGQFAKVIGTVCMDMFMIDVSNISGVAEGDEVIIFGASLPVEELARLAGTIPYEIMTGVSQRVKRVYYEE